MTAPPKLELLPAIRAEIFWDSDIPDVRIVIRPKDDAPEREWDRLFSINYKIVHDYNSLGACCSGWMTDHNPARNSRSDPEHVFTSIITSTIRAGTMTEDYFWTVVQQFARLDACEWARTMLQQLTRRTILQHHLSSPIADIRGNQWDL